MCAVKNVLAAVAVVLALYVATAGLSVSARAAPAPCSSPVCSKPHPAPNLAPQTRAPAPRVVAPSTTQTDWPTFGFNLARTGSNPVESALSPATAGNLNEVWSHDLGANVDTQPIVAAGVTIAGNPTSVVYAGSEDGDFFALDAAGGNLLWKQPVGDAQTAACFDNSDARSGVSSAPVVDRTSNTIYVAGGGGQVYALDMSTGQVRTGWPIRIISNPSNENVWSALTLSGGKLYTEVASRCDATPYFGRVTAINLSNLTQLPPFYVVPPSSGVFGGGIWGWGGASTDSAGNLYVATGNAVPGAENVFQAEHVVSLSSTLGMLASNAPGLTGVDRDFGATPTLYQAPGCPLQAAVENKFGALFIYNAGSIGSGPVQRLQVANVSDDQFVGLPAYSPAQNMLYVSNSSDSSSGPFKHGLLAFSVQPNCTLSLAWQQTVGPNAVPSSPPTVANGVVYYGDAWGNQTFAFNAQTGQPLWNSGNRLGGAANAAPSVVNGELFVPSWDHKLHAFDATGRPYVALASPNSITRTSANIAATLNPNGQATSYHFEYGTSTAYGSQTPDTSGGTGTANQVVTAGISSLSPNTTYHYRLDATNPGGTIQGQDQTFTTSASPYTDAVLSTGGIRAYLRLGEGSGTTAFDNLGSFTGAYFNSPKLGAPGAVQGDPNTAVSFSGQAQYASFPRPIQDDFTLEFWFNSKGGGIGTGNTQWWQGAGLVDGEVPNVVNDFGTSLDQQGQVWAGTGNPDTSIHSQPGLNDGNWHYVAFTRARAAGTLTLYIDGILVSRQGGASTQSLTNPLHLRIGMLQSGINAVSGSVDEIAAYTSVLSPQSVRAHLTAAGYNPPGTCPPGTWQNLSLTGQAVAAFGTYPPSCQAESNRSDLRGGLTSEVVGQPFSTLAAPPTADQWYAAVEANNVVQPLVVHPDGTAVANSGNNGFLSLENMRVSTSSAGWTNLVLQNGWRQAGGVLPPSYRQDAGFVELRGGLNGGSTGQVIANLPPGQRPGADQWYSVVTANNVVAPLLIQSNGNISLSAGVPGFLALDGVRVPVATTSTNPLVLQNGWRQAPGVDTAGVVADGAGFATLTGGVNGGSTGQVVSTLPSQYRPMRDVWLSVVTAGDVVAPLVIHPDGTVVLAAGNPGFLSLAGLRIPTG